MGNNSKGGGSNGGFILSLFVWKFELLCVSSAFIVRCCGHRDMLSYTLFYTSNCLFNSLSTMYWTLPRSLTIAKSIYLYFSLLLLLLRCCCVVCFVCRFHHKIGITLGFDARVTLHHGAMSHHKNTFLADIGWTPDATLKRTFRHVSESLEGSDHVLRRALT